MITYAKRLPPNKPVKFSEEDEFVITKTVRCSDKFFFNHMEQIICNQIKFPNKDIVEVFNFKILRKNEKENNFTYSYDMKRLGLLSKDERLFIDYGNPCELILPPDMSKLSDFLKRIKEYYFDIHSGNILLDEDSSYKLIDLEGMLQ